jgi:hypothetical protein
VGHARSGEEYVAVEPQERTDEMVVHRGRTTGLPRFAMIPEWLLGRTSAPALVLYARMSILAQEVSETGDGLTVQLTLAKLAEAMKVSTRTVQKLLRELKDAGAVRIEPAFDGTARLANRHVLQQLPPPGGDR